MEFAKSAFACGNIAASTEGAPMEPINQFEFYDLGKKLAQLASNHGDVSPNAVLFELFDCNSALEALSKGKPLPLGVSREAAAALLKTVSDIFEAHFREKDEQGKTQFKFPSEQDPAIPAWRFNMFRNALSTFETVFGAEMREATAYFVPRRGIYFTPALVNSADESFPESIRPFIPEKTKEDWKSAGRCLAFSLLSASGFHVARAVEGTIETYYQTFSGKPGATLKSWNEYAVELDKIATGAAPGIATLPSQKTLVEFRQMKDDGRVPASGVGAVGK
jgi:hypothetical protein